ncbi:YbaN family protein [Shewanella sp. 1_MG-2023]|uniref:Inner membrane protein n=1 Tax=Shewanella electrodiphila TaxID=934143 RepID=A0ABT0KLX4_9GAMM|nr:MULTISPECIES: YbaN family protein [Shewanella]MCC4832046.1 YbaN family protein [Shewanella sp. 10N.7]MCL1044390.1 YbaN family protein [Shewanella electrodiphila]MDO6611760.1 YbaN family protein [Shewanella sp. 7_MG-2023]MDO6771615.1 YbaN family protein [Shewanella sp. 2_MG-2023]MDO6793736.1 YbaN family protein [Shewanella sp. 1_MG-2023]
MSLKRGFFVIVGLTSVTLGTIGIVVPLLPTVPFILLAAYCFARSSDRLHHWLMTHPWFSQGLNDWQNKRSINKKLKRKAMIMTTLSFVVSIAIVPLLWVQIMLVCMLCVLLLFMWQIPELD